MLQELYVENFALIEALRLPLDSGFNTLSGETGAGKSLLIDAVSFLLGSRATDSLIRSEADRCLVEGVFCAPYPAELISLIEEAGQELTEENLILTREIRRGGKSVCRLNGRVVNLSFLRSVGRLLVNIHGQMEHMLLLDEAQQLHLLDSFGGPPVQEIKAQTAAAFSEYGRWRTKCRELAERQQEAAQKTDWLSFQLKEIADARLQPDEEELLNKEYARLANGEKLRELAAAAYQELTGALDRSAEAVENFKSVAELDEDALELAERLSGAYYELEDAARDISAYAEQVEADPYALAQVQERLALIRRLEKKYGPDIDAVLHYAAEAQQELAQWQNWEEDTETAQAELARTQAQYEALAAQLTNARTQAADKLAAAISAEFKLLYMPQAVFQVEITEKTPAASGHDQVAFMIRANPGEPFQPVEKTASGGELSRIVLAIKVILAQLDQVPTLIFDEVDSGLGGVALDMVAGRISKIAQYTQVLTITHAPLMAAAADHHIHIYKEVCQGRTVVRCQVLTPEERVQEIARMIAGGQISEATIEQAKKLLS